LAIFDAIGSGHRLSAIRIAPPEVLRLSVGRDTELLLQVENDGTEIKQLRIGLAFPDGIFSSHFDHIARLSGADPYATISWPIKAMRQGQYFMKNCFLETPSKLGLWAMRHKVEMNAEIRVYPDIFRERRKLSALFLNRGIGVHAQRQVGKGREFEQLREYLPGDSMEDIHWKATAKRGQPITKVYQLERTQQIYYIIDASRLSTRDSNPRKADRLSDAPKDGNYFTTIMERFAAAALVSSLAADRLGDLFGLIIFDDKVRKFIRAKNGRAHYNTCRDMLYDVAAREVSPDYDELFTFIGTQIQRRALLIILTNLDDPVLAESFAAKLDIIKRRHVVLVNMLKPLGADPLFSSPEVNTVDEVYNCLAGHILWRHLRDIQVQLRRCGVGFYLLENENLCSDMVAQYLSIKRRQVL
jgi:uncharacterized protein (DUF58 family)